MHRRTNKRTPYRVSLAAMFTAFTLLCLYLAYILPVGRVPLYFVSALFVTGLLVEDMTGAAFLMYVAASLLGMLIMSPTAVLPYILLFGHFGIAKFFMERIRDKVLAVVLKLIYWNVCMAAIYFLAYSFIAPFLEALPIYVVIILAQVIFFVFDFLYSKATNLYFNEIRSKIIR